MSISYIYIKSSSLEYSSLFYFFFCLITQNTKQDLPQSQRTEALTSFRTGDVRLLFATDVAARGLDVADIDLVINYDFPVQRGEGVSLFGFFIFFSFKNFLSEIYHKKKNIYILSTCQNLTFFHEIFFFPLVFFEGCGGVCSSNWSNWTW